MVLPIELYSIIAEYIENLTNFSCVCQAFNHISQRQYVSKCKCSFIHRVVNRKDKRWAHLILSYQKNLSSISTTHLIQLVVLDYPKQIYDELFKITDDNGIRWASEHGEVETIRSLLFNMY